MVSPETDVVVKCRGIDMVWDSIREAQPGFLLCLYCLSHQEAEGTKQPWNRGEGDQRHLGLSGEQGWCKEKAEIFRYRMICLTADVLL